MRLIFLRHGKTLGNLRGAYIGSTDEPLSPTGREALLKLSDDEKRFATAVIASPMLRCRESAALLYPILIPTVFGDLRECDFGDFEGLTYEALKEDPAYRQWLDSGGFDTPPGGEGRLAFSDRCTAAFREAVAMLREQGIASAAFVVHGGVIMAVLERFAVPKQDFYHWQVQNGGGYTLRLDETVWPQTLQLLDPVEILSTL